MEGFQLVDPAFEQDLKVGRVLQQVHTFMDAINQRHLFTKIAFWFYMINFVKR